LLRILPFLDPALLRASARPIVGFSDGTALLGFAAHAGVASIHGPVISQLGGLPVEDQQTLIRLLEEPHPGTLLNDLDELIPGRVQGRLLGGNLEVFSRLVGTPYMPDLGGAILFFEDLGERPYRVDRLLTFLDLAGVFGAASAVIAGDFSSCLEPEATRAGAPTVAEVLIERLGRLPIPVALGAAIGHGSRNAALPYGCLAELDTRHGAVVALEGAVSD
jgi:muramoyltetrapeptide carboxypeptidase